MTESTHIKMFKDIQSGDIIFHGRVTEQDLMLASGEMSELDLICLAEPTEKPSDITQNIDMVFSALDRRRNKEEKKK